MDFWDDTTMRLYVGMQHQERVAQGAAARRFACLLGQGTARARLAAALVALAARLDPAGALPRRGGVQATPANPA